MIRIAMTVLVAGMLAGGARAGGDATPTTQETADEAVYQLLKQVRLIEIQHLRSSDAKQFRTGSEKLLAIDDPLVVGPLVHVLYGPNDRYRALLVELLEKHAKKGTPAAKAYLQEVAVGDGYRGLRQRAVEAIKASTISEETVPTERLMAHLALDEVPVLRERAAEALASLEEKRAVWLLVERLVTEEYRLVGGTVSDYSMQFDIRAQMAGSPTFRQRTITAAVPAGVATVTIDLPQVQVIDVATTVAMRDRNVSPQYKRVEVQHPGVLRALRALTGKDFGYDQTAWQRWLQSGPEGIPEWEPIRFRTGGQDIEPR